MPTELNAGVVRADRDQFRGEAYIVLSIGRSKKTKHVWLSLSEARLVVEALESALD